MNGRQALHSHSVVSWISIKKVVSVSVKEDRERNCKECSSGVDRASGSQCALLPAGALSLVHSQEEQQEAREDNASGKR